MVAVRNRRIIRRTCVSFAAIVFALASYVSAWLVVPALAHYGIVSHQTATRLENSVFEPIEWYCDEAVMPGGECLMNVWDHLNGQYFD